MKRLAIMVVIGAGMVGSAAGAGTEPPADRVRELFALSGVTREAEMIVDQLIQVLRGNNPGIPPGLWDQLREEMKASITSGEYVEKLIPVYQKHLSAQDVESLIAFRKSDAGRRFTELQPKLMADSMQVGRAWGARLGQRALEKLKAAPARTLATGYIDKTGKVVIAPAFELALDFVDGLAPVRRGGQWGYVDKTGKMTIPEQFELAGPFSEGLAPVKVAGKFGFIDKIGASVIEPKFDDTAGFKENLAAVKIGDKYGFIDKKGTMVIEPRFDRVDSFSDGMAMIEVWK